jgi:hypothetical protein
LQEAAVGNRVQTVAPSVVDLSLKSVAHALQGGQLKAVVMTVGAGRELCHCAEPGVCCLTIRERREAAGTYRLVSVNLREVGLVCRARANVLRQHATASSNLVLDCQTPLHEVGRMQFAGWDGGDCDRRKTGRRVRER